MTEINNQAEMEAALLAQEQATARHSIAVMKALIDNRLSLHEVDFDALTAKVNLINGVLDGDEQTEGFQIFAALSAKLDTVEATANNNAAAITALQNALNSQIATMTSRVDTVEEEARSGREALDARITALSESYSAHVAAQLTKDNTQNTRLDDHQARIEALESAKALHADRLALLETDNTANKTAIAQLLTTVAAQSEALNAEKARAEQVEAELRGEIATERSRVDQLVTDSQKYATRQNVANAKKGAATGFCNTLWAEAGLPMPSGMDMPDGSVSP